MRVYLIGMMPEDDYFDCAFCGRRHDLLEAQISYSAPDAYLELSELERESRGEITVDFCEIDDRRFINSVLLIPVKGRTEEYGIAVWTEVSVEDFQRTVSTWDDSDASNSPPLQAKLANSLQWYEGSLGSMGELYLNEESRPFFFVTQESKLCQDQTEGVTEAKLSDFVHN